MTTVIEYLVTVLSDRSIRLLFQEEVDLNSANNISNYSLSVFPLTGYLPSLVSIERYSSDYRQYRLEFSESFTYNSTYSIIVNNVFNKTGTGIVDNAAHNFVANVPAGPVPLISVFSILGHCDVVFDREVGPHSLLATGTISNGVDPAQPLTLVPWASGIPSNNIRFQIPPTVDPGDNWVISFNGATDISGNSASGSINLSFSDSIPTPLNYSIASSIQVINSFITNYNYNVGFNNIRVFFNFATDTSVNNEANWAVFQIDTHQNPDNFNFVTSIDATNLVELCDLLNEIKEKYNLHILAPSVHLIKNKSLLVTTPNATDLDTAYDLLISLLDNYRNHVESEILHNSKDGINSIALVNPIKAAMVMYAYANDLKVAFNSHILPEYGVPLQDYPFLGKISSDLSLDIDNPINSICTWSADIRVKSKSPKTKYRVECSITSSDGSSTTNPLDFTGQFYPKSADQNASIISNHFINQESVVLTADHEFFNYENQYLYQGSSGPLQYLGSEEYSSIHTLLWSLREAWVQFNFHRDTQEHFNLDTINVVDITDLPFINTVVASVNLLKEKYLRHKTEAKWHKLSDNSYFKSEDATDLKSAISLLSEIRRSLNEHSGNAVLHKGISSYWISSPLFDSVIFKTGYQKIGDSLNVEFPSRIYVSYLGQPSNIIFSQNLSWVFSGVGQSPFISDVVPIQGISWYRDNDNYLSDSIQVFFNKPMNVAELGISTISPVVPGDSVYVNRKSWVDSNVYELNISNMSAALYSLNVSGISDKAGNQVS